MFFGVKFKKKGGYLANKLEFQASLNRWICEVGGIGDESEFSFEIEFQQAHNWQFYN